ncbi:MAG: hypothetical protein PVI30_26740 [Myxococcales bacterium]|jgi:hypothetical protein
MAVEEALRGLLLATALCGCTSSQQCVDDVSECIARCESATDVSPGPAAGASPPANTLTECERRCGCRKHDTRQPPPRATPTGM